mgnify:CR=1 FL=1
MREASRINDAVNEAAKHYIKVGMTEREVAEFYRRAVPCPRLRGAELYDDRLLWCQRCRPAP